MAGYPQPDRAALEIRLFGCFALVERGCARKFRGTPLAASLLAFLIVHRTRATPRDSIALTFWPDYEQTAARANLRRHLALIGSALSMDGEFKPISADYNSVQWNARFPCTIDVLEFERLSTDDAGLAQAVELYRGDLLPDTHDEWIFPERERLRAMQSANLERLTDRHTRAGDFARALTTTRALLLHDPWREDALRSMLSLRHACGDRAGALEEYERFAKRLRVELDAAPMPETTERYESIRGGSTADAPQAVSAIERSTIGARMPFVGRADELARLRQLWMRAMRGSGGVAVVSGEAGIGKSRLISEFGAMTAAQGGAILAGATTYPEPAPYQCVIAALRSELATLAALDLEPTWLAAAAEVLPELRDGTPALVRLPELEPDRQQDRLFEALWRLVEGLSRARPLLMRFEDVHWAGPATTDLLAYLARRVRATPVLVLITCRDDAVDAARPLRLLRHALRRGGPFASLRLTGIGVSEVARVVAAVLPAPFGAAGFAERAHELCSGNPFYLAEIVSGCLSAPATLAQLPLPASLATSVDDRVSRLSAEARSIAEIAAVVGGAFSIEIVARAAGMSEGAAAARMDELLDARLIRASGEGPAADADFAFAHDIVRSRLYERVTVNARRRLHRRIGFVLEALDGAESTTSAGELARHFDLGAEPENAAAAYLRAARQAIRQFADGDALRALTRALQLTADPELRASGLALREPLHGRWGRRTEQIADIEALESLAARSTNSEHGLECLRRRIMLAQAVDDADGQQRGIDRLRARLRPAQERSWFAFCSEAQGALFTSGGRYDEALAEARAALRVYRELGDDAGTVRSLCLIADISTWRGDAAASADALDEAMTRASASSNERSIVRALAASSLAAYMAVDYERAHALARQGRQLCAAIGDRQGEADSLFRLGNIAGRRFEVAAAVDMYAAAMTLYEALDKPLGHAIVLLNTGLLYLKTGDHAGAMSALKRARRIFIVVKDLRGLTVCALNLGMAAYLRGRFGAALRLSQRAVALARRLGNPQLECSALGNVGAAERELGEHAASVVHCEAALDQRRQLAPMDIGSDLADMGLAYLAAGDIDRARRTAEEIEALGPQAIASVMFPQNVLWSAARIYAAAGDHAAQARVLLLAHRQYERRCDAIAAGPARETYRRLSFNRAICAAVGSDAGRTPDGVHFDRGTE